MPFRVEIAKQGRAGCKNKECKDAGVKIDKGEFRYGTLVDIQGHQSWTWKHWGCVTPLQIDNLIEASGGDTDMVDGYDEVPEEFQEKVQFALENGHVPDEDWKGDVEVNRPGQKGFRVKAAPKKKGKKATEEADDAEEPTPKPKKRGRAPKVEDEEEAPAPKKARGRGKKAAAKEEPESDAKIAEVKVKKVARGKKVTAKKEESPDGEVELPEPKPKRAARTKKAPVKYTSDDDDDVDEEEKPETPKPKRGKKKAPATETGEKAAPQKRGGRKKKVVAEE